MERHELDSAFARKRDLAASLDGEFHEFRKVGEEETRLFALRAREAVGGHARDRFGGEHSLSVQGPSCQQHGHERPVIVDGRDEPAGGVRKRRRRTPPTVGGVVEHGELTGFRIGRVEGRQPVQLTARHGEARVAHAEWPEDAFVHHRLDPLIESLVARDDVRSKVWRGCVHEHHAAKS